MAKGIFLGKSRSQRAQEAISNPVLKFTDALPRNDLRDLNKSQNGDRLIHPTRDIQRPRTSDARQQSNKVPNPTAGFDFRINVPPPEVAPSPSHTTLGVDEQMIGIALGSPRMVGAQHMMSQMQEKLLDTPPEPPKSAPAPAPMQRKPSKWKKIGGFFKAKHAMTSTTNQPFYKVRSSGECPLQGSSHSVDYQPRTEPEIPDTKPISNTEVWPCLVTEPEPNPKKPEQQKPATLQSAPQMKSEQTAQPDHNGLGPMLNIDIPDVQMERYSVMFGGLLGKGQQPAPLNRRSKTLDDITNIHEESSAVADLPPPRRRATSPRPKTPSFTLFPTTQMTKASKVLGTQNLPRGPSPFHRSQSSLALVDATHRDTLHNEQDHILLMVHSPSVKSPSSHRTEHSVTSFLSTSSVGAEEDEAELLQKIKPVKSYIDPKEEPQWEIIHKNQPTWTNEAKQKLAQSLTVNTQELPSESASVSSPSSSPILSPLDSVTEKLISPAGSKPAVSPADSTRMPLSDVDDEDDEDEDEKDDRDDTDPAARDSIIALPKVEVSIARSVSVSKGRKQMLVPIGPRADRLSPDERLVTRGGRTPRVMDAQYRHRHGNSQELRIETI